MLIRDLYHLPRDEQQAYRIETDQVKAVAYDKRHNPPYVIYLMSGKHVQAKGHDRFEDLNLDEHKPVSSNSRIRRYGEFGSTIN